MATEAQREHAVAIARELNKYAEEVPYLEKRPMVTADWTEKELDLRLKSNTMAPIDCSESVTLIDRLAGLSDPNGNHYDGEGYTGDMYDYLEHFTEWEDLHKGSLILFWGDGVVHHVVMVVEPNGMNPMVYTHGAHASHAIWDFDTEKSYHPGAEIILLAIGKL